MAAKESRNSNTKYGDLVSSSSDGGVFDWPRSNFDIHVYVGTAVVDGTSVGTGVVVTDGLSVDSCFSVVVPSTGKRQIGERAVKKSFDLFGDDATVLACTEFPQKSYIKPLKKWVESQEVTGDVRVAATNTNNPFVNVGRDVSQMVGKRAVENNVTGLCSTGVRDFTRGLEKQALDRYEFDRWVFTDASFDEEAEIAGGGAVVVEDGKATEWFRVYMPSVESSTVAEQEMVALMDSELSGNTLVYTDSENVLKTIAGEIDASVRLARGFRSHPVIERCDAIAKGACDVADEYEELTVGCRQEFTVPFWSVGQ